MHTLVETTTYRSSKVKTGNTFSRLLKKVALVEPDKGHSYQRGLLWLTGLKFKNSLMIVSKQGPLTKIALRKEASAKLWTSCTELPACTAFLPSEPALIKEFLE